MISIPAFIVCLIIGLVIAGVVMYSKWRKLKSVRFERTACNYVRDGSFRVTTQKDMFLFSNVTRTPRAQNNASVGGGVSRGAAPRGGGYTSRGGGVSRGGGGGISRGGGGRRR